MYLKYSPDQKKWLFANSTNVAKVVDTTPITENVKKAFVKIIVEPHSEDQRWKRLFHPKFNISCAAYVCVGVLTFATEIEILRDWISLSHDSLSNLKGICSGDDRMPPANDVAIARK
uniref:Uncharacterized protein n=1 Tax=Glossina austeni TaxID=7395 RepID=A0A1A9V971_GLOAU